MTAPDGTAPAGTATEPILVRPIAAEDAAELRRFHAQLSPESVYYRFFAPYPELRDVDVAHFTHVDHVDREALVAFQDGAILGVGRYDRLADRTVAEVAFVVRDDVQGHGIGTLLLRRLTAVARERGIHRFVALVLMDNLRMKRLFEDSGYALTASFEDGYVTMELWIDPDDPAQPLAQPS